MKAHRSSYAPLWLFQVAIHDSNSSSQNFVSCVRPLREKLNAYTMQRNDFFFIHCRAYVSCITTEVALRDATHMSKYNAVETTQEGWIREENKSDK